MHQDQLAFKPGGYTVDLAIEPGDLVANFGLKARDLAAKSPDLAANLRLKLGDRGIEVALRCELRRKNVVDGLGVRLGLPPIHPGRFQPLHVFEGIEHL